MKIYELQSNQAVMEFINTKLENASKHVFSMEKEFSQNGEIKKVKVSVEFSEYNEMQKPFADGMLIILKECYDEVFQAVRADFKKSTELFELKNGGK